MIVIAMGATAGCAAPPTSGSGSANPYFNSRFTVSTNSFTFGQDPSWTADGRVLSNEGDQSGTSQVYVSRLNGTKMSCLTCGQPGPNGFPQERPQGDWILFCSFRGQTTTLGAPCLGGIGSDIYAMRPDGSHVTRLTSSASSFEPDGTPYDNLHPYWSPDGRHLIWTHLAFDPRQQGGTQWTILLATFEVGREGTPHLGPVTVVAPGGDNAYETQVWAPDGSGVLYTAFTSGGDKRVGWLNTELYFLRLYGHGASPAHPQVTRLTDGSPSWDEQAAFTPDMKDVIWMSSRGSPTWYQMVVTAAQRTGFDPALENDVAGPFFVFTILDPKFRADLYELDLSTHAIRRLTELDQVVPEFYFDPTGTKLLWTTGKLEHTYIGSFSPSPTPAPRTSAGVDRAWLHAPRRGNPSRPVPVKATGIHVSPTGIPPQEVDAVSVLQSQLSELARLLQGLPQGATCCQAAGPLLGSGRDRHR